VRDIYQKEVELGKRNGGRRACKEARQKNQGLKNRVWGLAFFVFTPLNTPIQFILNSLVPGVAILESKLEVTYAWTLCRGERERARERERMERERV
jgi:hypothetical protein